MKSKRDYRDFLQDIVENAQKAISFVGRVKFQDFKKNEEKMFAVIMRVIHSARLLSLKIFEK